MQKLFRIPRTLQSISYSHCSVKQWALLKYLHAGTNDRTVPEGLQLITGSRDLEQRKMAGGSPVWFAVQTRGTVQRRLYTGSDRWSNFYSIKSAAVQTTIVQSPPAQAGLESLASQQTSRGLRFRLRGRKLARSPFSLFTGAVRSRRLRVNRKTPASIDPTVHFIFPRTAVFHSCKVSPRNSHNLQPVKRQIVTNNDRQPNPLCD